MRGREDGSCIGEIDVDMLTHGTGESGQRATLTHFKQEHTMHS